MRLCSTNRPTKPYLTNNSISRESTSSKRLDSSRLKISWLSPIWLMEPPLRERLHHKRWWKSYSLGPRLDRSPARSMGGLSSQTGCKKLARLETMRSSRRHEMSISVCKLIDFNSSTGFCRTRAKSHQNFRMPRRWPLIGKHKKCY